MRSYHLFISTLVLLSLSGCTNLFQSAPPTPSIPVTPPVIIATGTVIPPVSVVTPLTPFMAKGTEPFWALEQTATGARFSEPSATGVTETWYTSVETIVGGTISIV